MVRQMARVMEQLQNATDGGEVQQSLLQKTGELLAETQGHQEEVIKFPACARRLSPAVKM